MTKVRPVKFGLPASAKCDCKESGSGGRFDHIGLIGERSEPKGKVVAYGTSNIVKYAKSLRLLACASRMAGVKFHWLSLRLIHRHVCVFITSLDVMIESCSEPHI